MVFYTINVSIMQTFCQIIQYIFNVTNEITFFSNPRDSFEFLLKESGANDTIEKHLFYTYIISGKRDTKSKFLFLNTTLSNIFMSEEQKESILNTFSKIQRIYHLLSRCALRYKFKKTKVHIDKDIFLNPLDRNNKMVMTILQNKKLYLFAITDLVNIINNALGNTCFFYSETLACKNPYNNIPFNKSTIYNIYFFIRNTHFIMPNLFHQFFLANLNLKTFQLDNESLIRDFSIKHFVEKSTVDELYDETKMMLQYNTYGRLLDIDDEFPKETLVKIMRPYLLLHLTSEYALDENKRDMMTEKFDNKIKSFYYFNKHFGKKKLVRDTTNPNRCFGHNIKWITVFNDKCVEFSDK